MQIFNLHFKIKGFSNIILRLLFLFFFLKKKKFKTYKVNLNFFSIGFFILLSDRQGLNLTRSQCISRPIQIFDFGAIH